jgi:hypothetical protein
MNNKINETRHNQNEIEKSKINIKLKTKHIQYTQFYKLERHTLLL